MHSPILNATRPSRIATLGLVSLLAMAVAAGCSTQANENPPPPAVSVAPVLVEDVALWDSFSGRIEAAESVQLRPRVSGYIDRVHFAEGEDVRKGDVLFTIDPRPYQAVLARARADLARAKTLATQSRSEADRARRLSEQQAISTETWEQRRATAEQAQADVLAAQAAVDAAQLDLEFTRVRAPIDGRAGRALVTAGNLVGAGDAAGVLATVVSREVYAYFDADEHTFLRYAGMARSGERPSERDAGVPVRIGLANEEGYPHAGTVDFLDNQIDRSTGTIRARARFDNRDGVFTPGLFARVQVLGSGERRTVLIDDKAVLTDQDRKYVYVVDAQGLAQRRDVRLGRQADGLRIVENGLAEGDKVIVSGLQKVFFPGMPVDAKPVAMRGGAAAAEGAVAAR